MILPKKKYCSVLDEKVLDSEGMKELADEMSRIWKGWEFKGEKEKITKMQDEYLEIIKFLRGE